MPVFCQTLTVHLIFYKPSKLVIEEKEQIEQGTIKASTLFSLCPAQGFKVATGHS